jgi:hypothetical protein
MQFDQHLTRRGDDGIVFIPPVAGRGAGGEREIDD